MLFLISVQFPYFQHMLNLLSKMLLIGFLTFLRSLIHKFFQKWDTSGNIRIDKFSQTHPIWHILLYSCQAFDPTISGTFSRLGYTEKLLSLQQNENERWENWTPSQSQKLLEAFYFMIFTSNNHNQHATTPVDHKKKS